MEQMQPQRWTIHDLEQFPQPWDDTRYEIIDGELYISTQPHLAHQFLTGQLITALWAWGDGRAGMVLPAIGLIFAEDEAVAPDLVWVAKERMGLVLGRDGKLHAAPDLVVEILSPGGANEFRDRVKKLEVYSRRGVSEYWIIDWRKEQIEVYRHTDDALRPAAVLREGDLLESPLLPGFCLSPAELFASIPQPEP